MIIRFEFEKQRGRCGGSARSAVKSLESMSFLLLAPNYGETETFVSNDQFSFGVPLVYIGL